MKKLMVNRCQCRKCKEIIESKHRHDYVVCRCGAIATDGGKDYIRRAFKDPDDIIDLSEYWDDEDLEKDKYPGISGDLVDFGMYKGYKDEISQDDDPNDILKYPDWGII